MPKSKPPPAPDIYSWLEVLDLPKKENRDQVEKGILSPGNIWLIFAPSASFKSMIAMNIAKSLAEGGKVLGKFQSARPLKVLYIDKEVGIEWFRERVLRMAGPAGLSPNLFVASKGQAPAEIFLDNYTSIPPLVRAIEKTEAEVLVLDCLNPLMREEESQAAFKEVERTINTLAIKFPNLSFILIHHMREIRSGDDPLSMYAARDSTKLIDMAATRMPMQVLPPRKMGKGRVIGHMRAAVFLRHGAKEIVEFYIDQNFLIVDKVPSGVSKALEGI